MKCVALLAIAFAACAGATAAPISEPSRAPARASAVPAEFEERAAPGATSSPPNHPEPKCQLELSTVLERRGKVYEVKAIAKNISDEPLSFELPDRCPQGPIVFDGLPEGYDYYRSCAKGACGGNRTPIPILVDAGESVELAFVEIDPAGANCTAELPSGRYSITFGIAGMVRTCAGKFGSFEYESRRTR